MRCRAACGWLGFPNHKVALDLAPRRRGGGRQTEADLLGALCSPSAISRYHYDDNPEVFADSFWHGLRQRTPLTL
jgi:hypothetical protein